MILKQSQLMVPVKTQQSQMQLNQEQQVLIRHPSQTQRVVSLVVLEKKPHLCDVIEQSTQQIKQMQEIIQSNSITWHTFQEKRRRSRVFSTNDAHHVPNYDESDPNAYARSCLRVSSTKSRIYTSKLQLFIKWNGPRLLLSTSKIIKLSYKQNICR